MTGPARRAEPDPPVVPAVDAESQAYVGAMSYADYRRMDEESDMRLEYVNGVVYAMSGGTRAHARIAANVVVRLHALCAGGCTAYSQGFKVRTQSGNEYVPDVLVECGPPGANQALYTEVPCLVVEILSPSTARTDFSEKRPAYQAFPSLAAYLIIEAEWRGVHRHWRDEAGEWRRELVAGAGDIPVPCPGGTLSLAEIYAGLDLPPEPPRPYLRRVYEPGLDDARADETAHPGTVGAPA